MAQLLTPGSAEVQLLLLCSRPVLTEGQRSELRGLLLNVTNWPSLWKSAEINGLVPLLHWHLRNEGIGDEKFQYDLAARFRAVAGMNLMYAAELVRVMKLLEENGVVAAAFKGPLVASELYGNLALREMSDLDILVDPENRDRTIHLLLANGYAHALRLTKREEEAWNRMTCERPLRNRDRLIVDLHWGFSPEQFPFRLTLAELRPHLTKKKVGHGEVTTFGDEDTALVLASHGSKHFWERLEWLVGFAVMAERDIDWDFVVARARKAHALRQLAFAAYLARDLLGSPVPPPIAALGLERKLDAPIAAAKEIIFSDLERPIGARIRLKVMRPLYDRRIDLVRGFLDPLFLPQMTDWQAVPLPAALHPLYRLIRPARLAWKYTTKALRR